MTLLNGSRCSVGLVASMGEKTTDHFISRGGTNLPRWLHFQSPHSDRWGQAGKAIIHIHASLAMNRQAGVRLYHGNRLFPEGSPPLYQTEIQDTFESKMFSMVVTSPNACCLNQVRT